MVILIITVFFSGGGEDRVRLGGILAGNWQRDNQTPAGDDHYNYFDHFVIIITDYSDDYYHYGDDCSDGDGEW